MIRHFHKLSPRKSRAFLQRSGLKGSKTLDVARGFESASTPIHSYVDCKIEIGLYTAAP
jgi:hypothetical protein